MREGRSVDLGLYRVGRPAYGHRPGTLDPGAVTYLMREHAMSAAERCRDRPAAWRRLHRPLHMQRDNFGAVTPPSGDNVAKFALATGSLGNVRPSTKEREFSFDIKPPATTPGGNAEYG